MKILSRLTPGIVAVRSAMVLFWIGAIFAFLFLPVVSSFLSNKKSISLFIWPMILDAKVLARFEQETGVKVYVNYYESNEELYSKLKATKGKGYDLIVPTDYMMEQLIADGLVKKIDKNQFASMQDINTYLLGQYFDPSNDYSIPYYASIFGLGVNTRHFGGVTPVADWGMVFDKERAVKPLCMYDSAREAIMLAAFYLYGEIETIATPQKLHAIAQLLIAQKEWVDIYTNARVEELLASGSCPLAVGTSPDIWKAVREYPTIQFVVQEGSFVTIDSFAIPAATYKDDLVYQLLNYLYQPDLIRHNSLKYGFCPPTTNVSTDQSGVYCPVPSNLKSCIFLKMSCLKSRFRIYGF